MLPDGLDQSWGYASPATAKAQGIRVVSMYVSWDASKNITPAKVKAYHQAGVAVLLNWESMNGAPLKGASQGTADATEAVRQVKALFAAVGYQPKNRKALYFSCDVNTDSSQWPVIAAYYKAAKAVCNSFGFRLGVYGEADLLDYLASNGISQAEWQTIAWSGGRVSTYADFYQFQIGAKLGGADVDYDKVLHEVQLGAWWPPGHRLDAPPAPVASPAKPVEVPPVPAPVPAPKPAPSDLPTTGDWSVRWTNADTETKRSAAGWLMRAVNILIDIQKDVKAIRAKLGA